MKYFVDYQYLPKGAARPVDNGEVVPIEISAKGDPAFLPDVGDYVHIDNSIFGENRASFSGKVRSRYFRYICSKGERNCAVNVVVEQTNDDFGKLVKE
jgi:hypothetical protein